MSELQVIESALQRAARRQRWARALRGLWHGCLIGAILSFLLICALHFPGVFPHPLWMPMAAAFLPLPFMVAGLVIGGWRRPALNQVARWVEGKQHLQERLSTALEVATAPEAGRWRDLLVTDAAGHAKDLDTRRLMPFSLPKASTRWALVVLALTAGLGLVPAEQSKALMQKETDKQVNKDG